ncbi:MAG: hypothetical protein IH942_08665 [Acidobacteria bacterium]|nr:hypothetical protein [Acidobacteriota bacterium]
MPRRTRLRTEKRLAELEAYARSTAPHVQPPWEMTADDIAVVLTVLERVQGRPAVDRLIAEAANRPEAGRSGTPGG